MNARTRWGAMVLLGAALGAAAAQENGSQGAAPSDDRPEAAVYLDSPTLEQQTDVAPDRRALTGMIVPGVGTWGPRHSFVVPTVSLAGTGDSGTLWTDSNDWRAYASVMGQVQAIQYLGRTGQLRYAGAARADSSPRIYGAEKQASVHDLGFSEVLGRGGWGLLLGNETTYSQGAMMGAAGMEGMGATITQLSQWNGVGGIGLGSIQLQAGLSPEQSILTMQAGRLGNTAVAEIDRRAGQRGMFTVGAYYSLLHFFSDGLFDLQQAGAVAGFDRQMTERDRLGVQYGYMQLDVSGQGSSLNTNSAMLLYGRRIAGTLAVQMGAGPQLVRGAGDYAAYNDLNWQGRGSATVQVHALNLQASASRMLTAGSGVLNGAMTNSAQASLGRTFFRVHSMWGSYAYARNTQVASAERYDTQVVGASYARALGRTLQLFVSYNLQNQTVTACTTSSCGITGRQQAFGAGLSWTGRPIGIR